MKLVVRIFNLLFIACSVTALILLYVLPSFTFHSNIGIDVNKLSSFIPETKYTKDVDVSKMIGTDTIHVGIQLDLSITDLHKAMRNDRDTINEEFLENNITDLVTTLQEPVDIMTEYIVRLAVKSLIQDLVKQEVQNAIDKAGGVSKPEDIMDEVGLDDLYFTRFAENLYKEADKEDASVSGLTNVLYNQIDDAITRAGEIGDLDVIDISGFDESAKTNITSNLVDVLDELNITKDGGKLKRISELSYIYLANFLKDELTGKVSDNSVLNQKSDENNKAYSTRMINLYVTTIMPDLFYNIVSYVSLGLFIGLFVFAVIWAFLLLITILKSLTSKPWTFFGPLFWLGGILEIVLGLGLTIFCKFILPKMDIDISALPINSFAIVPRTYALGLSIVFLVVVILIIPYTIVKMDCKKAVKGAK